MFGSLGSLVVSLEANTAKLDSDMGRAAYIVQKHSEEVSRRAVAMGTAIGIGISVGVEVAFKAIERLADIIPETIERMDRLSKTAEKVGLPTEEFSKLNYAASLADVSTDSLEKSLGKLIKSQAAAINTTSQQAKIFDALGISVKNSDGTLRSSSDVLGQFADRFKALKGSPEAIAAGMALFGRNFQEIIPLLQEGSEGLHKAGEEATALGIVLDERTGKAAELVDDNFKRLHTAVQGLWQGTATQLLPTLVQVTNQFVELVRNGDLASHMASVLGAVFSAGVGILHGYENAVQRVSIAIQGLVGLSDGMREMVRNIQTLGIAEGSVSEGFQKMRDAAHEGQAQLDALNKPVKPTVNIIDPSGSIDGESMADFKKRKAFEDQQAATEARLKGLLDGAFGGGAKKGGGARAQVDDINAVRAAYDHFQDTLGRLQGFLDGPLAKAEAQHSRNVRELNELAAKGKVGHDELTHALQIEAEAYAKEQDEIKSRYATEIAALQGPLAKAEDDHRLALREINQLVAEGQLKGDALSAALKEEARSYNEATIAAKRAADPLGTLLQDMQTDINLMGMSNNQRAIANELMREGISLYSREGQAALAQAQVLQHLGDERAKNIQFMDSFRSDLADLGVTALYNFGQIGSSFKKMMDDLAQQASRRILENWINGAFGEQGTDGQATKGGSWIKGLLGSLFGQQKQSGNQAAALSGAATQLASSASPLMTAASALSASAAQLAAAGHSMGGSGGGGGFGDFFSSLFSSFGSSDSAATGGWGSWDGAIAAAFGGGYADGGDTMKGRFYEVGELDRPELYQEGGRSYLLPGNAGRVTPLENGGGGLTQVNNFNYAAPYDARTEAQKNGRLGYETNRALSRNR